MLEARNRRRGEGAFLPLNEIATLTGRNFRAALREFWDPDAKRPASKEAGLSVLYATLLDANATYATKTRAGDSGEGPAAVLQQVWGHHLSFSGETAGHRVEKARGAEVVDSDLDAPLCGIIALWKA